MTERFVLLPWKPDIFAGRKRPPEITLVYPVLASFMNRETKLAYPSHRILRVLCRCGFSRIQTAISLCRTHGMLEIQTLAATRGREKHRYRLLHKGGSSENIALPAKLMRDGIWGMLTDSARALYIVLHALSWAGHHQVGFVPDETYYSALKNGLGFDYADERFIPAAHYDPAFLQHLAGISSSSFTRAIDLLQAHRLVTPSPDTANDGLILLPPGEAPGVHRELRKAKAEDAAEVQKGGTRGGIRSLNRLKTAENRHDGSNSPEPEVGKPSDWEQFVTTGAGQSSEREKLTVSVGAVNRQCGSAEPSEWERNYSYNYSLNHPKNHPPTIRPGALGRAFSFSPSTKQEEAPALPPKEMEFLQRAQRELEARRQAENQQQKNREGERHPGPEAPTRIDAHATAQAMAPKEKRP